MSIENYRRASKKQLEYIASLYDQLGETNITLYKKFTVDDASKLILRLSRKLEKQKVSNNQLKLL